MLARYKLPIMGKVLRREPLKGDSDNPICPIPIEEIPDMPSGYTRKVLEYNIDEEWCEVEIDADEEFHEWLNRALKPEQDEILSAVEKYVNDNNLKLDKSSVEEYI
jgi:hypothetical protein